MPINGVFHRVTHIIHICCGKNMWKNGGQMCFLGISEKPEKPTF
jgi:hypothetical protein